MLKRIYVLVFCNIFSEYIRKFFFFEFLVPYFIVASHTVGHHKHVSVLWKLISLIICSCNCLSNVVANNVDVTFYGQFMHQKCNVNDLTSSLTNYQLWFLNAKLVFFLARLKASHARNVIPKGSFFNFLQLSEQSGKVLCLLSKKPNLLFVSFICVQLPKRLLHFGHQKLFYKKNIKLLL